jgi:hypothetical protein
MVAASFKYILYETWEKQIKNIALGSFHWKLKIFLLLTGPMLL